MVIDRKHGILHRRGGKRRDSLGKRPQISDRALSLSMHQKKRGSESKKQKQNPYKDTKYKRNLASLKPRDVPSSSAILHEIEQRYEELDKRLNGEQEAATHEESERLERKHEVATHQKSEIPERLHTTTTAATTEDDAEILEQHATTTAAVA